MRYTTFNKKFSTISSFDTIGYDKNEKRLCVYFFNEEVYEFYDVDEGTIYQFIISPNKEKFYYHHIFLKYEFSILNISISS